MTKHLVIGNDGQLQEETRCRMKLCLIDGNELHFYGEGYRLTLLIALENLSAFQIGETYPIVIPHE